MARQKESTYITENKPFSKNLRELMFDKNSSQTELAAFVKCTRQAISLYATGQSTPDIDILLKIAQYFHVSTDYLLGLTDVKTPDIDIRAICEKTGLSEKAIQAIINIKNNESRNRFKRIPALTSLLEYDDISVLLNKIARFIRVVEESKASTDNFWDIFDGGIDNSDDLDAAMSESSGVPKKLLDHANVEVVEEFVLFGVQDSFIKIIKGIASYEKED